MDLHNPWVALHKVVIDTFLKQLWISYPITIHGFRSVPYAKYGLSR